LFRRKRILLIEVMNEAETLPPSLERDESGSSTATPVQIQIKRIELGYCPTCGIQTQFRDESTGQLKPVTNKDVLNSRCILCNPLMCPLGFPGGSQSSSRDTYQSSISSYPMLPNDSRQLRTGHHHLSAVTEEEIGLCSRQGLHHSMLDFTSGQPLNQQQQAFNTMRRTVSLDKQHKGYSSSRNSVLGKFLTRAQKERLAVEDPCATTSSSTISSINMLNDQWGNVVPNPNTPLNQLYRKTASDVFQDGWDHMMGDHFRPIDKRKGETLIANAMNNGSEIAKGFCTFRGWGGLEKNSTDAFDIFMNVASSEENPNSFAMIGYMLKIGLGPKKCKDMEEAIKWLKKAVSCNHSWAQCMMAYCIQEGEGIKKDETTALNLYLESGKLGYSKARYNLGELYHYGSQFIKVNKKKALYWYTLAAQQGHDRARFKVDNGEFEGRKKKKENDGKGKHRKAKRGSQIYYGEQ